MLALLRHGQCRPDRSLKEKNVRNTSFLALFTAILSLAITVFHLKANIDEYEGWKLQDAMEQAL